MANDSVSEQYSMRDPRTQTVKDHEFAEQMSAFFPASLGTDLDKLRNFTKFVPRQTLSIFLAKYELFKLAMGVHGNIVECGVYLGGGMSTWVNLSAMFEPYNHTRRVIGFDTFSGFVSIDDTHDQGKELVYKRPGGLATDALTDVQECLAIHDLNRPIGHIPRHEFVVGDAIQTIPEYVQKNPHLVVALLYLDFDVFEPTRVALEHFLPRMPKGALLVFDELNDACWPGETMAVLQTVGLQNLRIQRFPFVSQLSYAVIE